MIIGFLLVFAAITLASSATLSSACLIGRARLRAWGPSVERRAAAAALVIPPLLAAGVTLSLAARSAWSPVDHCLEHSHHLHLCVVHGSSWSEQVWAVAFVAGAGAWLAVAALRGVHTLWIARTGLARIDLIAQPTKLGDVEISIAPARTSFCFAAGIFRPRIFVSSEAWSRWSEEERRAAIEHEKAHLASKDVLGRLLLTVLAFLGAPLFARRTVAYYDEATERDCDRRAATAVGDPTIVASALLACVRGATPVPLVASFLSSSNIAHRIEAVLSEQSDHPRAARVLTSLIAGATIAVLACSMIFADPLHHLFESIFG